MRAFCMLTKVPSTDSTPVGMPRSRPTLSACRARVPAPWPRIIWCRPRLATISSISGKTAARPRSMKLWPPILTTLAWGRMWMGAGRPVRASSSVSDSEPSTSAWPSSVSSSSLAAIMSFSVVIPGSIPSGDANAGGPEALIPCRNAALEAYSKHLSDLPRIPSIPFLPAGMPGLAPGGAAAPSGGKGTPPPSPSTRQLCSSWLHSQPHAFEDVGLLGGRLGVEVSEGPPGPGFQLVEDRLLDPRRQHDAAEAELAAPAVERLAGAVPRRPARDGGARQLGGAALAAGREEAPAAGGAGREASLPHQALHLARHAGLDALRIPLHPTQQADAAAGARGAVAAPAAVGATAAAASACRQRRRGGDAKDLVDHVRERQQVHGPRAEDHTRRPGRQRPGARAVGLHQPGAARPPPPAEDLQHAARPVQADVAHGVIEEPAADHAGAGADLEHPIAFPGPCQGDHCGGDGTAVALR